MNPQHDPTGSSTATDADPHEWRPRLRTNRMEAFSDGVFAIAITLLVLEIQLPDGEQDVAQALVDLWPSYVAYVSSFLTLGAVWLAHSTISEFLTGVDSRFLRLNLLLLMLSSFLPFPSGLLADSIRHPDDSRVAAVVYGVLLFALAGLVAVMWRHALGAGLVDTSSQTLDVKMLSRRLQPATGFYLATIAVAVFVPRVAVVLYPTIAVFVMVPIASIRRAAAVRQRPAVRRPPEPQ